MNLTEERGHNTDLELLSRLFCRALLNGILREPLEAGGGLTIVQLSCLHYVQRHQEANASDVAEGLAISRAAATNLVERLVRKGLVTRRENPEDRRQVFIGISDKGKKVLADILARQREHFCRIAGRMKGEDLAALQQGLRAFLATGLKDAQMLKNTCARCGVEHVATCPVGLLLDHMGVDLKY